MTAGGPYFRQVAASAIGCWQQAFEGGRRRSLSSREGSPGANSAKAVFLSVLTQRHLRIILGTFGRYRQQPFDTHSVPVCTPNFSSASYPASMPARHATKFSTRARIKLLQSKVKKYFPLYNFVIFWFFLKNSLTNPPQILRQIQIRSQNKQGVST